MVSSPSAREGDLDGGRPGGHGDAPVLPAPGEDDPVRRAHFDVLAPGDVGAVDVDPVDAARGGARACGPRRSSAASCRGR